MPDVMDDLNEMFACVLGEKYAELVYFHGHPAAQEYPCDPPYLHVIDLRDPAANKGPLTDAVFSFEPLPKLPRGKRRTNVHKTTERIVVERKEGEDDLHAMKRAINEHFGLPA